MPELPEVETICRQLAKKILNKKIIKVEVITPSIINIPKNLFIKNIQEKKFTDINRRAKLLILGLSTGGYLIIHLKLNGHLIFYKKKNELHSKFAHIVFYFSDNSKLVFDDFRKFGYIKFIKSKEELNKLLESEEFGPEPLNSNFTLEKFKELLIKKPKSPIKTLLMDQTFIAGIGNVYAQEICFYARVNPKRKVNSLTSREIKDLYEGTRKILVAAIEKHGNSVDTYLDAQGHKGEFQNYLKVYDREGKPCFRCGEKIKKIWIAGRGTSYCPGCQK